MIKIFFFVCLLGLISSVANAQVAGVNCTAMGIDFSPLNAYTLSYINTATNWTYVFRMCGNVNDDSICNSDPTSHNSMICQRRESASANAWALAQYQPSNMLYTATRSGMSFQYVGGETCGATGNARFVKVNFICDASAVVPRMISAGETTTCRYEFNVQTNLVCRDSSFCRFNGIDFINLFGQGDLTYQTTNHMLYFHMCSPYGVEDSVCRNDPSVGNSMFCQKRLTGNPPEAFALARWEPQNLTWSAINTASSAGIQIVASNGEYCTASLRNRVTRFNFLCDRDVNETYSYISGFAEVQPCIYEVTIHTRLVCSEYTASTALSWSSSSSWFIPPVTQCRYGGYDFLPLYNAPDLNYTGFVGSSYYNVFFHMCGMVRDVNCLNDSTTYNSMICQQRYTDLSANFAVAHYLPLAITWFPTQYGGVLRTLDDGERCGSSNFGRTSNIEFRCNPDVFPGRITGFTETATCVYLTVVETSIVCNGSNTAPVVASTGINAAANCIHENTLDFNTLNPATGDLTFFARYPDSRTFNIYMRLCDRVQNRDCRGDSTATNTMVCQQRTDRSDAFNLASYNTAYMSFSNLVNMDRVYTGVRLRVTGGESCGATSREITIDFTCNSTIAARTATIISFAEPAECAYTMQVVANDLICPFLNSKNGSSSDSGLSGGMIALIVIVIIVGVAAIIAAIAAWKFYGSPFAFMVQNQKGEKDIEMQNENNTSYEHEESTTGENI